jgi:hypothetical protein
MLVSGQKFHTEKKEKTLPEWKNGRGFLLCLECHHEPQRSSINIILGELKDLYQPEQRHRQNSNFY